MTKPKSYAIVAEGVVINVIWVQPNQAKEFDAVPLTNAEAGIGWRYTGGEFTPAQEEPQAEP
jgi:hypothetical protein